MGLRRASESTTERCLREKERERANVRDIYIERGAKIEQDERDMKASKVKRESKYE